jgi:hypothetical protein
MSSTTNTYFSVLKWTMAKRSLSSLQRNKIADKLMLLGNIVFSAMVIAPFVSQQFSGADTFVALIGGAAFTVMYFVAVWVMKGVHLIDGVPCSSAYQWNCRNRIYRLFCYTIMSRPYLFVKTVWEEEGVSAILG